MNHTLKRGLTLGFILMIGLLAITPLPRLAHSQNPAPQRIESDDASVTRAGNWASQAANQASGGSYLYSSGAADDVLTLQFSGPSIEVIFVAGPSLGTLAINVDDIVLRTVITTAQQTAYQQSSRIDYLSDEPHTLKVYAQAGGVVAIDAFVIPTPSPSPPSGEGNADGETRDPFCAPTNQIHRVSLTSTGEQADDGSINVSISGDGRFAAFMSVAALVPGDGDSEPDIYLYDRTTCTTELISVSTSGEKANDISMRGLVSGDGRYVAFESIATNLVAGDTNGMIDVFVRDRQMGTTTRVSVATDGTEATGIYAYIDDITPDGRYIVFTSDGNNLVAGDSNNTADVFVHDRQMGTTTRASLAYDGTEITSGSSGAISADGRYVAFVSGDNRVIPDDTNGVNAEIFVRDRQNETTTRVSVATGGVQTATGSAREPAISSDGRYVVFSSGSSDLVGGDTNGFDDVFVHDRNTNTTSRVSVASDGTQAAGDYSRYPSMSDDGRYIAFLSRAANIVAGTVNGNTYAYVHDQQTGITSLISVTDIGSQYFTVAFPNPALSGDGQFVAFASDVTTLVSNDTNDLHDIFVMPRFPGASSLTTTTLDDGRIQLNWTDNASDETEYRLERSPDGLNNWMEIGVAPANITTYTNVSLICGTTYHYRVRAYRASDMTYSAYSNVANATTAACPTSCPAISGITRASVPNGGGQTDGGSGGSDLSSDGRYIVFQSGAQNLVPGDTNNSYDAFVRDNITCQIWRVSVSSNGEEADVYGALDFVSISGDGRYVAFDSPASTLVPNDTNGVRDIFVHDRLLGQTRRISVANDGTQSNAFSTNGFIASGGRYVAFYSTATNLVPNDTNGVHDLYYYDLQTNTLTRPAIPGFRSYVSFAKYLDISGDGRYIIFSSDLSNLVTGDTNNAYDMFLYDRDTAQLTRISQGVGGVESNGHSISPSISDDGRYIAFSSQATNLVSNDTNGFGDIFVYDLQTGQMTRVSVSSTGQQNNSSSEFPELSGNARYVTFTTTGTTLVAGDTNGCDALPTCVDVFLHDRQNGQTVRLSDSSTGEQGNDRSLWPAISGDGHYVSFYSLATNLVVGDTNGQTDVFITPVPPAIPSNLTATTLSQTSIQLNWTDNASDETNFVIERSPNGTSDWSQIGSTVTNVNTFTDTVYLACGTTYYYRVRAYRSGDGVFSAYSDVASAYTTACLPDALALVNPATRSANLIHTLTNPPAGGDYTQLATGFPYGTGGQYVTGDWNGDGVDTLAVYRNGAFFYTNDFGTAGTWVGIWFGLGGQPVVGRFDANINHDCLGVTDSGTWTNGDTYFALYFTCNLTSGPTPPLTFQWLSILLPNSQGFTGTFQFVAGDFNGDGVDSVAVRRGAFIAWTNVPPTTLLSQFSLAQYIGAPGTGDEGKVVTGDWDMNNVDSFGLVYQNGTFYRRNDLDWNSGAYILQTFTPAIGTPFDVVSWRPN